MTVGLYTIFIEEWLKVFPREQFHILRLEDYTEDKQLALNDIFQFLGVGKYYVYVLVLTKGVSKHNSGRINENDCIRTLMVGYQLKMNIIEETRYYLL